MTILSRRNALALLITAPLAFAGRTTRAHAGPSDASAASALSLALPLASVVAAPVMILSAGAVLTVAAVDISVHGTVWILERASDGARVSLEISAAGIEASAITIGTTLTVTALSAGWILSAAGTALCFVPNAIGQALLYSERITP
ncbi:hypothetical protein [Aromatoleum petrolei]|uniref:Uncharacterized protein n=1 Tax=Aromatoleum petrolei TaxID=76116 RepID=A0ABX1MRC2_9RHOO|nr:hypothetical protein [Aromatoleum petrolei]NMF88539.1 hypothetical protein [Aromatoleum petrolei]QTQ36884.1 Uncharacterized protein ToN1_27490 [Aromatoleum petrolei]